MVQLVRDADVVGADSLWDKGFIGQPREIRFYSITETREIKFHSTNERIASTGVSHGLNNFSWKMESNGFLAAQCIDNDE